LTLADALNKEGKHLVHAIAEEAQVVQQFVDLLSLEQTALSAGDTDGLPALAEQKSKLAVRLDNIAAQRNATLVAMGFTTDRSGIEAWCIQHPAEKITMDTWASIIKLAREARELNRLNGELIQLRMNVTAAALEALRASKNSLDLYGPDGQSAKAGHRSIDHAV
jgi:flagellar biosynthesis protein FlgN